MRHLHEKKKEMLCFAQEALTVLCAGCADTKFMNLGFGEPPISLRLNDSSLALEGCEFSTNEPTDNLGIVTVDGESRTLVKIQNTSFSTDNVGNVTLLGVNGSRWYTDGCAEGNPCDMVVVPPAENGTVQPAQGIQQAPQGDSFLILADPWLQRVREVCISHCHASVHKHCRSVTPSFQTNAAGE